MLIGCQMERQSGRYAPGWVTLFEKMPMPQALSETTTTFEDNEVGSQLNLFSF